MTRAATIGARAGAALIDTVIAVGGGVIAGVILTVASGVTQPTDARPGDASYALAELFVGVGRLMPVAGVLVYFGLSHSGARGQTPGQRAAHIRIVREDGGRIGFVRAALRQLLRTASFLPFGLGMWSMIWDPRGRAWHDRLTGTRVVFADRTIATAMPDGRWRVIAAAGAGVVLVVASGVLPPLTHSSTRVDAAALDVGDCGVVPSVWEGWMRVTPCSEPHDFEVTAIVTHADPPDTIYNEPAIGGFASDSCLDAFGVYVGASPEDAGYVSDYVTPGEDAWADGDRSTVCFAYDDYGYSDTSLHGTGPMPGPDARYL